MKRNGLILLLVLANVVLLGMVAWQGQLLKQQETRLQQLAPGRGERGASRASHSAAAGDATNQLQQATAGNFAARNPGAPSATANWPAFDWRRVESPDYHTYVKNLRNIGCPEQTLRDIVTADVWQAFAAKRAEVAAKRYGNGNFKLNEFNDTADADFARQQREVDENMGQTLRDLLGSDYRVQPTGWEWKLASVEQQLSFLPAEKLSQVSEILRRFGDVDEDPFPRTISDNRLTQTQTDAMRAQLDQLDSRREELLGVLSPEEFERLDMTISYTAVGLRRAMKNFGPSEAEYTAIFREWRAHDNRIARMWVNGLDDPGNGHVFQNIEKFLGPERYPTYRENWWK